MNTHLASLGIIDIAQRAKTRCLERIGFRPIDAVGLLQIGIVKVLRNRLRLMQRSNVRHQGEPERSKRLVKVLESGHFAIKACVLVDGIDNCNVFNLRYAIGKAYSRSKVFAREMDFRWKKVRLVPVARS